MTKTTDKEIANFVSDVQKALVNLDPVVVGELTESLEADLLERKAEEGAGFKLGNAEAYAKELLASAGLTPASTQPTGLRRVVGKVGRWAWGTFVTARPAWWVLRGLAAYTLIWFVLLNQARTLPDNIVGWLVLVTLVVISIQVGRVRNRTWWFRAPLAALNILAIVTSIYWADTAVAVRNDYERLYALESSNMLLRGGQPVGYIYAFDAAGKKLQMQTLKTPNGDLLYEAPKAELSDAVMAVLGMTLPEANRELKRLHVNSVHVQYGDFPGVRSGRVASVQKMQGADGYSSVLLSVAN